MRFFPIFADFVIWMFLWFFSDFALIFFVFLTAIELRYRGPSSDFLKVTFLKWGGAALMTSCLVLRIRLQASQHWEPECYCCSDIAEIVWVKAENIFDRDLLCKKRSYK